MPTDRRQHPLTILIAEDEALIAMGLEQILEGLGHRVCDVASTAARAFAAADRHRPDLVMMDVMLRDGSDGIEAAQRIWNQFGIRSLFTTALDASGLRDRAMSARPLGFVAKPYHPDEFRTRLAAL